MYIPIIKILLSIIMLSLATGIALFFVKELAQHTDRIRQYKKLGDKLLQPMKSELRGERLSRSMLFVWFILIETTVLFFEYVAMKWLREVHGLNVQVCIVRTIELKKAYNATIYNNNCEQIKSHFGKNILDGFISYEEACEAAIKYCLENLI